MRTRIKEVLLRLPQLANLLSTGEAPRTRIAVAVGMASLVLSALLLFLHRFPLQVYRAQNDSMAPSLYRGDFFWVERLSTWFGKPERFDVVSYRYPLDQSRRLVHRVVGLPGERFRIRRGDLWVRPKGGQWSVLRKPPSVQRLMWRRVDPPEGTANPWFVLPGESVSWKVEGSRLEAATPGIARWGEPGTSITDEYVHGHSPGRRVELRIPPGLESNVVGDLRLSGWVRAKAECTAAFAEIHEGKRVYRFSIPGPAAPEGAAPTISHGERSARGVPFRLPVDEEVEFRVANLDDRLLLEIDGTEAASLDVESLAPRSNELRIGLTGGGGVWEDLLVERDIHYVPPPDRGFDVTIPDESYLLLGDNPQHFADPRFWRVLRLSVRGEDGTERFEGNLRPTENPRTYVEDGQVWLLFRDADGHEHEFLRDSVKKRTFEPAPFVPAGMIEGRVFAGLGD